MGAGWQIFWTCLGALLGAFIGAFFAIWQDNSKLPNLDIAPGNQADEKSGKYRFIHLEITNHRRTGFWQRFIRGNKPALLCKVQLEFLDNGTKEQIFSIQGRWSSAAEPVIPSSTNLNMGTFSPQQAFEAEYENILTGETKALSLALKHTGEEEFCGFNNWSYLHPNWKNIEWTSKAQSVLVRAHLSCDSVGITKTFRIMNPNKSIESFKVVSLNDR